MSKNGRNSVLKIDTDTRTMRKTLDILKSRLSYLHDLGAFNFDNVKKIIVLKKTNYAIKIYLKKSISVELSIIIQLIMGSDWRKEVNTLINYYILNMKYYNRMFDIKVYPNGKIKHAKFFDVTEHVSNFMYSTDREVNKN